MGFGELAEHAARQPLPRRVPLKDPATFVLAGRSLRRIEAAGKVHGSARFGIDVRPQGLLYASVNMCPTLGGSVARFDATHAQAMPGVRHVLAVDAHNGGTAGVAVIADTYFEAVRALARVQVEWSHGPASAISGEAVLSRLSQALDSNDGLAYHASGDVDGAFAKAARVVEAEYRAPWLAHAAMEPINCTVQLTGQGKDAGATVWASTQVPDIARQGVAKLLGVDASQVDMQVQLLGGGFGRRLEADYIVQAAAIARAAGGKPVQTIWSREQDIRHDFYRPACVSRFRAGLDADGRPVAWHNVSAGQAIVPHVLARSFGLPELTSPLVPDKTSSEGAFDQPYEWPASRVAHVRVTLPVPVGFLRSVGHSHHAFFKESFVDELAAAAGQDPVAFRASLLARHPRHLQVLKKAAELSGWGQPPAPAADGTRVARGVALHESFGSIVAQVAEVSLSAEKAIRVHRVICVIDCGFPLNPNLIAQQMESGIVFGLSAALYGEITIRDGQVQQSNFHDYPVLRLPQTPMVQTHIIPSTAHPQGVGEPGTPPVAPAVANALYALTGQRLRSLPLRPG
jgi:isoquinoline 1-oxidoreductase beta subunit